MKESALGKYNIVNQIYSSSGHHKLMERGKSNEKKKPIIIGRMPLKFEIQPAELQEIRQYLSFERNGRQNLVKCTLPIGGHQHQIISRVVNIPHLFEERFTDDL